MICRNCDRRASWIRTRCRACESRLPAWYVITTLVIGGGIYGAFLLLENLF
ncbi:MAG TPA: hypothetical protein VGJ37_18895 [Pyrinomonadaceae bacterium]